MKKLFLVSSFAKVSKQLQLLEKELVGKTVTLIPTASKGSTISFHILMAKRALKKLGFEIEELDITEGTFSQNAQIIRKNQAIYVAGGNSFFLLQALRKTGLDKLMTEEIEKGKLYIGESAGAMILAQALDYIVTLDSPLKAPDLVNFQGLGMIDFYPLPHFGNFPFKKATSGIAKKWQSTLQLCPITNSQSVIVEGNQQKVITTN